ncbi:MAG: PDZ domain-containing protein [Planctomycetaceae bacterium]|nr:PDZ domain-containing protein [Planctomycetaceae bacterium]
MKNCWLLVLFLVVSEDGTAAELYVDPAGADGNSGTVTQPFATLHRARDVARTIRDQSIDIYLRGGTHYLGDTLTLESVDSGTKQLPVQWQPYPGESPVLSGGRPLQLTWQPFNGKILQAAVPADFTTDQLFVNGQRLPMARYPNFDSTAQYFNGVAADCISPARASRWEDPTGGFFHAMHNSHWGDMHYRITGADSKGRIRYEGGWQNNRKSAPHAKHRFVENIFEELDAPGEWFHDRRLHRLFLFPPLGVDMRKAQVEAVQLEQLIVFRGDQESPVRHITLRGLIFTHTARTFMKNREPLLRSDWTTWRGGAVMFEGAEDCNVVGCTIRRVGSNGVFVNGYNRRIRISQTEVRAAGASSISFVGKPQALRSPLYNYHQKNTLEQMDRKIGPKTDDYPRDCTVVDCLLTRNGRFEKQTAGVNICMAAGITVQHCSIYDVPRAGINICDGAFGGHLVEHCDVFDTVKETGDHGSFNSWGRDRFWHPQREETEKWLTQVPEMYRWDAVETTVLRNNRWRCDRGWDIDLDDGSSNYQIYNNLCLSGGIKLREGYGRMVENNVLVNNTFHPHVWYRSNDTSFRNNIVFAPYAPAGMKFDNYGSQIDENFFHQDEAPVRPAEELQRLSQADLRSKVGDAMFVDPAGCDYRVKQQSPARQLGFVNFEMDRFGVQCEHLRAIVRTPVLPGSPEELKLVNEGWGQSQVRSPHKKSMKTRWRGALIKNIQTEGEKSAAGLAEQRGVMVLEVAAGSFAENIGLEPGDVVLEIGKPIANVREFLVASETNLDGSLTIWRNQQLRALEIK